VFDFNMLGGGRTIPSGMTEFSHRLTADDSALKDCPLKNDAGRGLMGIGSVLLYCTSLVMPFVVVVGLYFFSGLRFTYVGIPLALGEYVSSSSSELDSSLRRLRLLLRGQHGDSSKFIFSSISWALIFLSFASILKYIPHQNVNVNKVYEFYNKVIIQ